MAREVIGGLIKKSPHNKNYKELYDIVYNLKGRFVLKGAVQTYNELLDTHPEPHIGDAVHVIDDFRIYRWNGKEWEVSVDLSDLEIAENERIASEVVRVASEKTRVSNENIRKTNEQTRQSNEQERKSSEVDRVSAENIRISSENIRKSNEQTRIANEDNRVSAENTRASNETDRKTNEQLRQDNEIIREQLKHIGEYQSDFTYLKNNMVVYNGSTFMALKNVPTNTSPSVNLDTEYWQRVALRGDVGIEERLSSLEDDIYESTYSPELENTSSIFSLGTGKDERGNDIDLSNSVAKGQVSDIVSRGLTATNLIKNGSFEDDKEFWSGLDLQHIEIDSNRFLDGHKSARVELTSDSSGTRRLTQDIKIPSGHKIYYRASIFCENHNDIGGILVRHRTSNYGGYEDNIEVTRNRSNLLLKQWEYLSLIRDVAEGSEGIRFELTVYTPTGAEIILNVDNFIAIDLTVTFGAGNEPTKEECDKIFANWFDGTKSTVGASRIKSVGKNLFDGKLELGTILVADGLDDSNPNETRSTNFIRIKPSTNYVMSRDDIIGTVALRFYDKDKNYLNINDAFGGISRTINMADSRVAYVRFKVNNTNLNSKYQFEEGTVATPYEPYTESNLYITAKDKDDKIVNLRSLPNSTKDEIMVGKGKLVRKSCNYTLQPLDVESVVNRDYVTQAHVRATKLPFPPVPFVFAYQGIFDIPGWRERAFMIGEQYTPGIFSTREDGQILVFDFPLDTTLEQARQQLTGTTLTYQLAEPEIIPLEVSGELQSYPGGTMYVDPYISSMYNYDNGIVLDYPVVEIDKLQGFNNEGQWVELENEYQLSPDGKTLTVTGIKNGDKIKVYAPIRPEESTIPITIHKVPTNTKATIHDTLSMASKSIARLDEHDSMLLGLALQNIDLENNLHTNYATKVYAKDYTDSQIALITETGIPKLSRLEYILRDVPVGTTTVQIPSDNFDGRTDTVDLYINTTHKNSDDYTYTETGLITLVKPLEEISTLTIHVLKNVPMGEDGSVSGKVIAVDSLPSDRVQGLDAHLAESVLQSGGVHGLKIESGTWTPGLTTTNGDGVANYGSYNRLASYHRIGNLVYITFRFNVESFSNCTGFYVVSGLPFSSNSEADRYRYILTPNTLEGASDYSSIVQDQIRIRATPQSVASAMPFTSTKYINGSGVYHIG